MVGLSRSFAVYWHVTRCLDTEVQTPSFPSCCYLKSPMCQVESRPGRISCIDEMLINPQAVCVCVRKRRRAQSVSTRVCWRRPAANTAALLPAECSFECLCCCVLLPSSPQDLCCPISYLTVSLARARLLSWVLLTGLCHICYIKSTVGEFPGPRAHPRLLVLPSVYICHGWRTAGAPSCMMFVPTSKENVMKPPLQPNTYWKLQWDIVIQLLGIRLHVIARRCCLRRVSSRAITIIVS